MKRSKEDGWLVGVDLGLAIIVFTVARAGRQRCRGESHVCGCCGGDVERAGEKLVMMIREKR